MIYIRADMNETIATGHIMRCMTIADAVQEAGENITFIVADEKALPPLKSRNYNHHVLHSNWKNMDGELSALLPYLQSHEAGALLVDSYQVSPHYLNTLRNRTKLAYIDDINQFLYPADVLICYAIYSQNNNYEERYSDTRLLLGSRFTPLRKVFSHCPPKRIHKKVENLLLLSGGTDNEEALAKLLRVSMKYDLKKITVVCGRFYRNYDALREQYEKTDKVEIRKSLDNIDLYMKNADLALSAGGNTLYELCACGTPTISFSLADNQLGNVNEFNRQGIIPYAGDARKAELPDRADELLQQLIASEGLRTQLSRKMQALVDGNGAKRLALSLIELAHSAKTQRSSPLS